jgi:hypothetical protein
LKTKKVHADPLTFKWPVRGPSIKGLMYLSCVDACCLCFFCWMSLWTFYYLSPPFLVPKSLTIFPSLYLLPEPSPTFLCICQGERMPGNDATMHKNPLAWSYVCVWAFRCCRVHTAAGNDPWRQTGRCVMGHSHTRAASVVPVYTRGHYSL